MELHRSVTQIQKKQDSYRWVQIEDVVPHPAAKWVVKKMKRPIENFLHISSFNRLYHSHSKQSPNPAEIFQECLDLLHIRLRVSEKDIQHIPSHGPLVVIANHPFGGMEGIILGSLIGRLRSDVKIISNFLLEHIPILKDVILPVNPFGSKSAVQRNASSVRKAIAWVKNGGALIVFPAGEVSHFTFRLGKIVDPVWSPHLGGIVRKTQAKVLPVFFPGRNSILFNLIGLIHPRIRTALLAREFFNKSNSLIECHIGKTISRPNLQYFQTNQKLTDHLRSTTYLLQYRSTNNKNPWQPVHLSAPRPGHASRIITPISKKLLDHEIRALTQNELLLQRGDFDVYVTESHQIPHVLREIGRLREISFRSVHEGSGNSLDLDRFDTHYEHLFLWNRLTKEVAGAYRIGRPDAIVRKFGLSGLYTNSLFRFKPELLNELNHAIELGRSFVRPEYQRKPASLSLLWCGIGEFIHRSPHYKVLFGPVSISQNYHVVSKTLMVEFLKQNSSDSSFCGLAKPRHPYRPRSVKQIAHQSPDFTRGTIEDVSLLISGIEKDGKGVPVLIRHYVKLDGKFIAFNVDKKFSNVIDGLVFVDLTVTDPRILKRFMGQKGLDHFLSYHQRSASEAA